MQSTENQRLKILREALKLTQREIAPKVHLKQGSYADVERGKVKVSGDIKRSLNKEFSVNIDWIESGKGEMFVASSEHNLGIPMYDSVAAASQVEVYSDGGDLTPKFRVSIPQFADCEFGKMVFGHSMEPTISNGTYVFCKRIQDKRSIIPGEIYYIEYNSYAVVKRLQLGNIPSEILAVSDNKETWEDGRRRFEAFPIKIDEIRELFLVKGSFQQTQN